VAGGASQGVREEASEPRALVPSAADSDSAKLISLSEAQAPVCKGKSQVLLGRRPGTGTSRQRVSGGGTPACDQGFIEYAEFAADSQHLEGSYRDHDAPSRTHL
jgi:hypothetical protein